MFVYTCTLLSFSKKMLTFAYILTRAREGRPRRICHLELIKHHSPCLTCTRVLDPQVCENKECRPWRQWFIGRWALIYAYGQLNLMLSDPCAEHNVEDKRNLNSTIRQSSEDPCDGCVCPKDMCTVPCRAKRIWQEQKEDVFL